MTAQMILVAGRYRSGTNDDPVLIARNVEAMMLGRWRQRALSTSR